VRQYYLVMDLTEPSNHIFTDYLRMSICIAVSLINLYFFSRAQNQRLREKFI